MMFRNEFNDIDFSDLPINQSGFGILDVVKKIPAKVKTAINKKHGFPRAYSGELHPLSITKSRRTGKKVLAFNSNLGPKTNVAERLKRNVQPLPSDLGQYDSADRAGMAHDLRFALADNVDDLRSADNKFISKLEDLEKKGHPRFNTQIGIKGIKLKNRLEDAGLLKKTKFLDPFTDRGDISRAKSQLKKLEQRGYGPGSQLKRKIINKLGRVSKFRKPSKMIAHRMIPIITQMLMRKTGRKPKMIGSGYIKNISLGVEKILDTNFHTITQSGEGIGAAIAIGSAVLPVAIPLIMKLGKFLLPKIMKLFTKRKLKGSGVLQNLLGKAGLGLIAKFLELMWKTARKSGDERRSLKGGGFDNIIRKMVSGFVNIASKVIGTTKKILPIAEKVIGDIKGPKDVLRALLDKGVPAIVNLIKKKTGIKPKQMGKGITRSRGLLARRIRKGKQKIPIIASNVLFPTILKMFGIKRKMRGTGKAKKQFDKLILEIFKRKTGAGIKEFIKGFGKGFINTIIKIVKTVGPIAIPIIKEVVPILIKSLKK